MSDSVLAAAVQHLLAEAGPGLGGVYLRAPADDARSNWLDELRTALPPGQPWIRVPVGADAESLLGGLDLETTLLQGRPVLRAGLLARAHGGVLLLRVAERTQATVLALVAQALDNGQVTLARDGVEARVPARFTLVLLDEGNREDMPAGCEGLRDRLAFELDGASLLAWNDRQASAQRLLEQAASLAGQAARAPEDACPGAAAALCVSALQLGIVSLRAPLLALKVAECLAHEEGLELPERLHLAQAAEWVYTSRATRLPQAEVPPQQGDAEPAPDSADVEAPPHPSAESKLAEDTPPEPPSTARETPAETPERDNAKSPVPRSDGALEQAILASIAARLNADTLAQLKVQANGRGSGRVAVAASRQRTRVRHGRPLASRPGDPREGVPLDLPATLRAALPWQRLRAAQRPGRARLALRASDLRVRRLKPRIRSTAVFAVDASGSAALHRLAEAKGAVEQLLAQCYVRRDQVALLSFRGAGAEVLLPPTRALARARRELSAMPGGGGTPLAHGIDAAGSLADALRRRGDAPLLVLLTDGRANVSRAGIGGRMAAEQDALAAARRLAEQGLPCLLIDISPQPQPQAKARQLAAAMGAEYLALPAAAAGSLSAAVQARLPSIQGRRHD